MTKEELKQKRLSFSLTDVIVIVIAVALVAGIFIWSLFTLRTPASSEPLYAAAYYQNQVLFDNAVVRDEKGENLDYVISLRRDLKSGESYVSSYTEVDMSMKEFSSLRNFRPFQEKTIVINGKDEEQYGHFSSFAGPQVDLKIKGGKIRISEEESPRHICSNQGEVGQTNLPLVCLPNSIYFQLYSSKTSGGRRPDA